MRSSGLLRFGALGLDLLQRCTDDRTLVLHSAASALLLDLLIMTLMVQAAVENGPGSAASVLLVEEGSFALRAGEQEQLSPVKHLLRFPIPRIPCCQRE